MDPKIKYSLDFPGFSPKGGVPEVEMVKNRQFIATNVAR